MSKKRIIKEIIKLFGCGFGLLSTIVLYMTFLKAYNSGNSFTLVTINTFNEANIEFILIPILLVFNVLSLLLITKDIEKGYGNNECKKVLEKRVGNKRQSTYD